MVKKVRAQGNNWAVVFNGDETIFVTAQGKFGHR